MVECIFTIDYEIYGNGRGALRELVYEPARRLREIFLKRDVRFVNFVEVAEFEKIEEHGTDGAIDLVKQQVADLYDEGFEIALHLHPQWFNARREQGQWVLDAGEYNLCRLPRRRIGQIVERALGYLHHLVNAPSFKPLSFRAGNWLFQPTRDAAGVLADHGFRLDSSVFKGGVQHQHGLDYRRSLRNGYFWKFRHDVNEPDSTGPWIEVPTYSEMVPAWRMVTSKRMAFRNGGGAAGTSTGQDVAQKVNRLRDLLRFRYPLKLDFCRMTFKELTVMMDGIVREDRKAPDAYRPVVLIGHTKDLTDFDTVERFLSYLQAARISVSTFSDVYPTLARLTATPQPGVELTACPTPYLRTS